MDMKFKTEEAQACYVELRAIAEAQRADMIKMMEGADFEQKVNIALLNSKNYFDMVEHAITAATEIDIKMRTFAAGIALSVQESGGN